MQLKAVSDCSAQTLYDKRGKSAQVEDIKFLTTLDHLLQSKASVVSQVKALICISDVILNEFNIVFCA